MNGVFSSFYIKYVRQKGKYAKGTLFPSIISYLILIFSLTVFVVLINDAYTLDSRVIGYSHSVHIALLFILSLFIAVMLTLLVWKIVNSIYVCKNIEELEKLIEKHKKEDQTEIRIWKRNYIEISEKKKLWISVYLPLGFSLLFVYITTLSYLVLSLI